MTLELREIPRRVFLTGAEIPQNLPRIKIGQKLRVLRSRTVIRVGYRLAASDAPIPEETSRKCCQALENLTGFRSDHRARKAVEQALSLMWLAHEEYGGPHRGVLLEEAVFAPPTVEVLGKRVAQVGEYQAGVSIRDPWTGEWDCEPAGLWNRRTLVILETDFGEMLSGDLESL